jgi:hypothetical protein
MNKRDAPDAKALITETLDALDQIDSERSALNDRTRAAKAVLIDELALSKKALAAFLQRRRLDPDDRAAFDQTFQQLCSASGEPFQPDLFDAALADSSRESVPASRTTH